MRISILMIGFLTAFSCNDSELFKPFNYNGEAGLSQFFAGGFVHGVSDDTVVESPASSLLVAPDHYCFRSPDETLSLSHCRIGDVGSEKLIISDMRKVADSVASEILAFDVFPSLVTSETGERECENGDNFCSSDPRVCDVDESCLSLNQNSPGLPDVLVRREAQFCFAGFKPIEQDFQEGAWLSFEPSDSPSEDACYDVALVEQVLDEVVRTVSEGGTYIPLKREEVF